MTITDTTPEITATPLFAKLVTPCVCSQVAISWGEETEPEGTDCEAMTKATFAPGHDAKLKGLLIKAGAAGAEIQVRAGGMLTHTSAENVAAEFGFVKQVAAGILKARTERDGKAEREAKAAETAETRAAAKVAKATEKEALKVKRAEENAAKATARAEAKAAADAAKAAKTASKAVAVDGEISAKVDRKVINGRVEDGVFVYEQDGEEMRTAKFTLV